MSASESLRLLDLCAEYSVDCYLKGMSARLPVDPLPTPALPDDIPPAFSGELRVVSQRIIEAASNRVRVHWSAKTYSAGLGTQSGGDDGFENTLRTRFPPLDMPTPLNCPFIAVDIDDDVVLWSLPDMLLPERQAAIAASMGLAANAIAAHPPGPDNPGSKSRWRNSNYLYAQNDNLSFGRGMTTLSPGWLAQGNQGLDSTLHVSSDLGARPGRQDNPAQTSAQTWLAANMETGILLSAALAITHPAQYRETRKALEYLATLPDFARHMETWTFAFNVVTLICNRRTPAHRDRASGGRDFYDLLLTLGGGPRTILTFPGLGIRTQYDSGTVALFSGHDHLHEVSSFLEERVCIACYARPAAITWLNANHPPSPAGRLTLPEGWWDLLCRGDEDDNA